jgi:copper oxidase (laccase) domain-containing protein
VGEGTFDAFRGAGHHEALLGRWFAPTAPGKHHLDLWRATRDQLEGAGLLPANIHVAGLCTMTHQATFHSYRAHGKQAGRMLAAIRRTPPAR